jgi:AraC-like DNA-binding protein
MAEQKPSGAGFTVSAELVRGLIDCAERCGIPRFRLADLIDEEAVAKSSLAAPARYAGEHIFKVWDRVNRLSGDPIIGFRMALHAGPKTFGALGQILPRCENVLEAFRQTARYAVLASQAARLSVTRNSETLTVTLAAPQLPPGDITRTVMLWGLTNLTLLPERMAGVSVRPKGITCAFPAPGLDAAQTLRQHFSFEFDGADNRVTFERRAGDILIPSADADLKALLAEVMDRHLAALGPAASFEQGIMTVMRSMMNGNMPTLASVSARAGISQRTLQRRLTESNTSFQKLLRQVLHEMSDDLLARRDLSHGEIAFLLGYSEESAFSRAYRSWTGYPPGESPVRGLVG